jgi:hypothetical protein
MPRKTKHDERPAVTAGNERPTSIIRAKHGTDNPYFQMRRETAQNKSLSWAARGMLAYLLSQPDDWIIKTKDLAQNCKRDKVYSILEELEKARYVSREEVKDGEWANGRYRYLLYEVPYPLKPDTEKTATDEITPYIRENKEEHKTDPTEPESNTYAPPPNGAARASLANVPSLVDIAEREEIEAPAGPQTQAVKRSTDEALVPLEKSKDLTPVPATPSPNGKRVRKSHYVFCVRDGQSVYIGPAPSYATACTFANGHGTVTERQAIPLGSKIVGWPDVPKAKQPPQYGAVFKALVESYWQMPLDTAPDVTKDRAGIVAKKLLKNFPDATAEEVCQSAKDFRAKTTADLPLGDIKLPDWFGRWRAKQRPAAPTANAYTQDAYFARRREEVEPEPDVPPVVMQPIEAVNSATWRAALDYFKAANMMDYETWIKPLRLIAVDRTAAPPGNVYRVLVANERHRDWLVSHALMPLAKQLTIIGRIPVIVQFEVGLEDGYHK